MKPFRSPIHFQLSLFEAFLANVVFFAILALAKSTATPASSGSMPPNSTQFTELIADQTTTPLVQAVPAYSSIQIGSDHSDDIDPWAHDAIAFRSDSSGTISFPLALNRHVGPHAHLEPYGNGEHTFWLATETLHSQISWDGKILSIHGLAPSSPYAIPFELWLRSSSASGDPQHKADQVGDCAQKCILAMGTPTLAGAPASPSPSSSAVQTAASLLRGIPLETPLALWLGILLGRSYGLRFLRKTLAGLGFPHDWIPMPVRQTPVG